MADEDKPSELGEQFLRANANPEYIATQFADCVRDMMRAFASDEPNTGAHRASSSFSMMIKLLSRLDGPISSYQICRLAAEDLTHLRREEEFDEPWILAARSGLKMLVEQSCFDTAARGRTSKRRREFQRDIEMIEMHRKLSRPNR